MWSTGMLVGCEGAVPRFTCCIWARVNSTFNWVFSVLSAAILLSYSNFYSCNIFSSFVIWLWSNSSTFAPSDFASSLEIFSNDESRPRLLLGSEDGRGSYDYSVTVFSWLLVLSVACENSGTSYLCGYLCYPGPAFVSGWGSFSYKNISKTSWQ